MPRSPAGSQSAAKGGGRGERELANLAELYRKKVASQQDALVDPVTNEVLEILRSLIDRVSVSAGGNGFTIELVGEIANMVRLSAGTESLGNEPYRSSVKVVAGARNHRQFAICVAL